MDLPHLEENREKVYDFYAIHVEYPLREYDMYSMYENLSGYTINPWVLQQFILYYENYLCHTEYHIYEYRQVTYSMFQELILSDTNRQYDYSDWIDYGITSLYDNPVFHTGAILEELYQYENDMGDVENKLIPGITEGYYMLKLCKSYLTKEFDELYELLDRLYNIYIFVLCCTTYQEYDGNRFVKFPDYVKRKMTDLANFPAPIEEMEFYDCVDYTYLCEVFVKENEPHPNND